MKRFVNLLFLASFLTLAAGAQDVFSVLEDKTRWELADAYFQVAEKFESLGQKTRAEEFRKEAQAIYPAYPRKPTTAPATTPVNPTETPVQGVTVDPLTGIPERPQVRQQNIQGQRIARYQFAKMLRGFLNEDLNLVLSSVHDGLIINGAPALSYQEILVPAKDFFTLNDFSSLGPSDLFAMESLTAADPAGSGEDVVITVKAVETAPGASSLGFWKPYQKYTFSRTGDTWKLKTIDTSDSPY